MLEIGHKSSPRQVAKGARRREIALAPGSRRRGTERPPDPDPPREFFQLIISRRRQLLSATRRSGWRPGGPNRTPRIALAAFGGAGKGNGRPDAAIDLARVVATPPRQNRSEVVKGVVPRLACRRAAVSRLGAGKGISPARQRRPAGTLREGPWPGGRWCPSFALLEGLCPTY
jgi:hypothetical protein